MAQPGHDRRSYRPNYRSVAMRVYCVGWELDYARDRVARLELDCARDRVARLELDCARDRVARLELDCAYEIE